MIKSQLVASLDFGKKKGVPHEAYTYLRGEQWYIVRCGPGYSNTHKVLEFDDAGLAILKAREVKDEASATPLLEGLKE